MGGLGSGRPASRRKKVESCRAIDIGQLHKSGCFDAACSGSLEWADDGERVALRAQADQLTLSYRVRVGNDEWQHVKETVQIVRMACRFGGIRPYFICPGAVNGIICGRRVAKLHGPGRYFLCRHCYRLVYTAQNESGSDRARRRAIKIRRRLGGDPSMGTSFPDRPKGMWERTYSHLCKQAYEAEIAARRGFEIRAGQFLQRLNQPKRKKGGRD